MASISPITLEIIRVANSNQVSVSVGYQVNASNHDVAAGQHYREICQLVGDDTPGDGSDDVLHTMFETTVDFSDGGGFVRAVQRFIDASVLDEDSGNPIFDDDEIRAVVTLVAIPTSRESNLVRIGGPVFDPV